MYFYPEKVQILE